jgi:hypothetical protein
MKFPRTSWELEWQAFGHIFKDDVDGFSQSQMFVSWLPDGMCFSATPVRENSSEARLPLGEQTHSDSLRGKNKPESIV